MTEVHVETVDFESLEKVFQKMENEVISGTSAGFGLPKPEKEKLYDEIRRGFRNYANIFLSNVNNDTFRYLNGLMRGEGEGHRSLYIIGEYKRDAQVGLFLCYKTGADSVGTVKNLEMGGFDGKYTKEMGERLCGRQLFDESFNHILATSNEPTLKIFKQSSPSAKVVEAMHKQLKETKESLIQRIAAYFR